MIVVIKPKLHGVEYEYYTWKSSYLLVQDNCEHYTLKSNDFLVQDKCWNQWPFVYSAEILILSIRQPVYQYTHTYKHMLDEFIFFTHSEFSIPMLY